MNDMVCEMIEKFKNYLVSEEKSEATISKYVRDVSFFAMWLSEREMNKLTVLEYKRYLMENYAPSSVNSMISSLNAFFVFNNLYEYKMKNIKLQHRIFSDKEKELTKQEYEKLLKTACDKNNQRLYLLMQTICATGIRVSELKYITVEAIKIGQALINCKGKIRLVFIPGKLCKMLKKYTVSKNITHGAVFVSKNGRPLDRSNIWSDMKKLCEKAGVSKDKVFPHNLRHLFARTFYSVEKDIVRLADVLGHSSINTTRIYTMENGEIHRMQIQKLGLLRC